MEPVDHPFLRSLDGEFFWAIPSLLVQRLFTVFFDRPPGFSRLFLLLKKGWTPPFPLAHWCRPEFSFCRDPPII